uniref:Phosphatidic acid phosphatase type 2/haloperoxidase domain-containing protein n=1 Tax=Craspedostauros australis TaxID=1486917 RepID=A0A7R9ZTH5_9STRA|mmetsp:Transcript_963/g.2774  ORF Transcript_963/g.2774 Transcript_963/m.2774 type:complete len:345 (+) Transcript_963:78-1112(+)
MSSRFIHNPQQPKQGSRSRSRKMDSQSNNNKSDIESSSTSSSTKTDKMKSDNDKGTMAPTTPSDIPTALVVPIAIFMLGFVIAQPLYPTEADLNNRTIPYQITSAGDVMLDLEIDNELISDADVTIPGELLIRTAITIPIMIVVGLASRKNPSEAIPALSGLLVAIGLTQGCTSLLKIYVLRRRPNFYAMCEFSKETLKCGAEFRTALEAQMSFPSGHASLTFGGMTYLIWYFIGFTGILASPLPEWMASSTSSLRSTIPASSLRIIQLLVMTLPPFAWGCYVAGSRLVDHWHHPADVLCGSLIGMLFATVGYHVMYPMVTSSNAGTPLSAQPVREEKLPLVNE